MRLTPWRSAALALFLAATTVPAAELPGHRPLRVVVVSDEVNPHGLPDASLTQPGELSAAIAAAGAGILLDDAPDAVVEIPTNSIEQATALLSLPPASPSAYDVLVYFAHRIPNDGNDAAGRQDAFTAAVEAFLVAGGGVVSFHHGAYTAPGKEGILDLIGATASGAVPWNTVDGQNVIATAAGQLVTCQGLEYEGNVAYGDPGRGVPADSYPFFNNTPDERYPFLEYNGSASGNVVTLFGSDYNENGTAHLLGWVHRRPGWRGRVIGYQPGEYQPQALDDLDGNNFQILANALIAAAGEIPEDQILLEARRGAVAGEVALSWAACDGVFSVHRSTSAADVGDPANELGQTGAGAWNDLPPAGSLFFYRIL